MKQESLNEKLVSLHFVCQYCNSDHSSKAGLKIHMSNYHREEHQKGRKIEIEYHKLCQYYEKKFFRSDKRKQHENKCKEKAQLQQYNNKRAKISQFKDMIIGPAKVEIKVKEDTKIIPIEIKIKKHNPKILKPQKIFNGDAKNIDLWHQIRKHMMETQGQLYDVVMIDAPWRISGQLPYQTLSDEEILEMPLELVQEKGILIMWIVNQKRETAEKFLQKHLYQEIDRGEWVKLTKSFKLYHGLGRYTSHCNETFIIAKKGDADKLIKRKNAKNVIFAPIGKHSEKPHEIYDFVQELNLDRYNLEIFGRQNNDIPNWDRFGNEAALKNEE